MVNRPARALLLTPRPDGADVGRGGAIAPRAREGADVSCLLPTNGDRGTSGPGATSGHRPQPHRLWETCLRGAEEPNAFGGIADAIVVKGRALERHAGQVSGPGSKRGVDGSVRANARRAGAPWAEGVRRIRLER